MCSSRLTMSGELISDARHRCVSRCPMADVLDAAGTPLDNDDARSQHRCPDAIMNLTAYFDRFVVGDLTPATAWALLWSLSGVYQFWLVTAVVCWAPVAKVHHDFTGRTSCRMLWIKATFRRF